MRLLRRFVRVLVLPLVAPIVLAGLAAGPARAQAIFDGTLLGASVNPPTASTGTGSAALTIDGDQLDVDFSFSGLTANSTSAHIHCCAAPPLNVGVAVGFLGFPVGVTSGVYTNNFDLTNAATYFAPFVAANGGTLAGAKAALLAGLGAGQAYTCVHTTSFPGSEIRSHFGFESFIDGFESGDALGWSLSVP